MSDKDFDFFKRVCAPIIAYLDFATPDTNSAGTGAMRELVPYLDDLLTPLDREEITEETIISSYLDQHRTHGQPSIVEIIRHVSLLIPAAIDTTNRLIANCIWMLCDWPELQAHLRANPDAIPSFVA